MTPGGPGFSDYPIKVKINISHSHFYMVSMEEEYSEFLDIYDETLTKIGVKLRREVHKEGSWHKSFHCWIVRRDEKGDYLLFQKRGNDKLFLPNLYDITSAGHYSAGETMEDGVRELQEELGIEVNYSELKYLGFRIEIYKGEKIFNREFCDVHILRKDLEIKDYHVDETEVEGLIQIKIKDVMDLFTGRVDSVLAEGIEWDWGSMRWVDIRKKVTKDVFIPRIDQYYQKMCMIAKLFLNGDEDVFI